MSGCSAVAQSPHPSPRQAAWSNMEFYLFVHFGPNTFTDLEWGKGTEPETVFNPSQLDCRQWCRIAKAAGASGIIITAKHHDGFCLWPSKYSAHTVKQSKWRNGQGDVLKELSQACREYGLKFGVYLSPWDRNHPLYGTPAYNDVFVNMMKEIVDSYGPMFEFWWDGANGEGPNGKKQLYDWKKFEQTMRRIAPQTVVFSDIGPDIRWVGNENGIAGDPNWDLLDTAGFTRGAGAPPADTLNHGNVYGKNWIPAECDVSIRPGWFYHEQEDDKVKTPGQLFQLYLKSVGRGASLLLNVPPDRRGLINAHDSAALMGFKKLRDENFHDNLAKKAAVPFSGRGILSPGHGSIYIRFNQPTELNCVLLKEDLSAGQQCAQFRLTFLNDKNEVIRIAGGNTIGRKRIISFPSTQASVVRLTITGAKGPVIISGMELYHIDPHLIEETN